MKKLLSLVLSVVCAFMLLAGCSGPSGPSSPSAEVSLIDSADMQEKPIVGPNVEVDIDLTALNANMMFAQVSNIMTQPADYLGKTIKMNGPYYSNFDNKMQKFYHFVVIRDAAACCAQGFEFVWQGEHSYPDDYPDEETEIQVIGIIESYEEDNQTWYRINAVYMGVI